MLDAQVVLLGFEVLRRALALVDALVHPVAGFVQKDAVQLLDAHAHGHAPVAAVL